MEQNNFTSWVRALRYMSLLIFAISMVLTYLFVQDIGKRYLIFLGCALLTLTTLLFLIFQWARFKKDGVVMDTPIGPIKQSEELGRVRSFWILFVNMAEVILYFLVALALTIGISFWVW